MRAPTRFHGRGQGLSLEPTDEEAAKARNVGRHELPIFFLWNIDAVRQRSDKDRLMGQIYEHDMRSKAQLGYQSILSVLAARSLMVRAVMLWMRERRRVDMKRPGRMQ